MQHGVATDRRAHVAHMLSTLLITILVIVVTVVLWAYYRSKAGKCDSFAEDAWLVEGLGVELPQAEIDAYEEAAQKLRGMKRGSAEAADRHKAAKQALMRRATMSLQQMWKASREMEKRWRMHRTNRLSDGEWASVQDEFEQFKEERSSVVAQAHWLEPGWPHGWGEGIFADAHRALLVARDKMLADGMAEDDERLPPKSKLRFPVGGRVRCNCGAGADGEVNWVAGTVVSAWELPYTVVLDSGQRVNAPRDADEVITAAAEDDAGTPSGLELALWRPFRFRTGDRVRCNCGEQGWLAGTVTRIAPVDEPKPADGELSEEEAERAKKPRGAYAVRLDNGRGVLAPMDVEQVIRAWTAEDEAAAPERRGEQAGAPLQAGTPGGEEAGGAAAPAAASSAAASSAAASSAAGPSLPGDVASE